MMMSGIHESAHPLITSAYEAVLPHFLVASVLSLCLIGAASLVKDPRLIRLLNLGAILVFLVPLPNLMPQRGIEIFQFTEIPITEAEPVASPAAGTVAPAPVDAVCGIGAMWLAIFVLLTSRSVKMLRLPEIAGSDLPRSLRDSLDVPPDVEIRLSSSAGGAFVAGLLRAVVVLPEELIEQSSAEELRAIILHELGHVRRRDNLWRLVSVLVTNLFWFQPLTWIAALRFRAASETVCDLEVLHAGVPFFTYLESLRRLSGPVPQQGLAAAFAGGSLKERIRIMKRAHSPWKRASLRLFMVFTIIATAGTGLTLRAMVGGDGMEMPTSAPAGVLGDYRLEYNEIIRRVSGTLWADFALIDRTDNRLVAAPGIMFRQGEPAMLTVETHDPSGANEDLEIRLEPLNEREVTVMMTVDRGGEQFEQQYRVGIDENPQPAPPVSFDLQNAHLHDVLETFAKLLGTDLILASDFHDQRVTTSFDGVPWDQALEMLSQEYGFLWKKVGNVLIVSDSGNARKARAGEAGGSSVPEQMDWPGYGKAYRISEENGVQPPRTLHRTPPVYTAEARARRVQGVVVVRALIDEDGNVRDTQIVKPLPFGLSESTEEAVRNWKFAPATKDGVPVPVAFQLTMNFQLSDQF